MGREDLDLGGLKHLWRDFRFAGNKANQMARPRDITLSTTHVSWTNFIDDTVMQAQL